MLELGLAVAVVFQVIARMFGGGSYRCSRTLFVYCSVVATVFQVVPRVLLDAWYFSYAGN